MIKKLRSHVVAKAVLYALAAVLITIALAGGILTLSMSNLGYYWESVQELEKAILHEEASEAAQNIYEHYWQNGNLSYYQENSGYMFRLQKEDGTIVAESPDFAVSGKNSRYTETWEYPADMEFDSEMTDRLLNGSYGFSEKTVSSQWADSGEYTEEIKSVPDVDALPEGYETDENYNVYRVVEACSIVIQIKSELETGSTLWRQIYNLNFWYNVRYLVPAIAGGCLVIGLVILIILMSAAGYTDGIDEIRTGVLERVPFDVFTLVWVVCAVFVLGITFGNPIDSNFFYFILEVAELLVFIVLCLLYLHSAVIRIKRRELIQGLFILKFWRWYKWWVKRWVRALRKMFSQLPLIWKSMIIIGCVLFIELIVIQLFRYEPDMYLCFWIIEKVVLVPVCLYCILSFRKLEKAAEKIAAGDEKVKIDTSYMAGYICSFAETLNHIYDGLGQAVEARLKSERLRTELITNVSHDIKTPLTSIVSYVDLLKKEELPEGPAREYVEVLERQSGRLKKLIEDLVEASKASTGNLTVNMAPCDVQVLLNQTLAEYQEKLDAAGLQVIVKQPEESADILADGRHMWRIFDNLLNNICKYAMAGTRVYLDIERTETQIKIFFRNISQYPLNIPADELMERFTRGDTSRHTEGSGLGLSIAASLVSLQKGTLELMTDGDLFKVILTFPASGKP